MTTAQNFLASLKRATCSICYEAYDNGNHFAVELPNCQHIFGSSCIEASVTSGADNSNCCPKCRSIMFEKNAVEELIQNSMNAFASSLRILLPRDLEKERNRIINEGINSPVARPHNTDGDLIDRIERILAGHIADKFYMMMEVDILDVLEDNDEDAFAQFSSQAKEALLATAWEVFCEVIGVTVLVPSGWFLEEVENLSEDRGEEMEVDTDQEVEEDTDQEIEEDENYGWPTYPDPFSLD